MYETENAVHKLSEDSKSEKFARIITKEPGLIEPLLREMLLNRFIIGADEGGKAFLGYCAAVGIDGSARVRMVVIKPDGGCSESELLFLKKRIETVMGGKGLLLGAAFKEHILVITDILEKNYISSLLERIRVAVRKHSGRDMTAVFSDVTELSEAPVKYGKMRMSIDGLFYADNSKIFYENDISGGRELESPPDYEAFEACVKEGDAAGAKNLLTDFFTALDKARPDSKTVKEICEGLYLCLARSRAALNVSDYLSVTEEIRKSGSFCALKRMMFEAADEIAAANKPVHTKIYSSLIKDTIETIDKNIENENLSLRWLAGTILYTNVDYLGKLFKKETGKNFSHYVMEKRMEMAKELILEGKKDRIYEVAEKVGYGSNSQYFSQVFKKYTGVSPLEYKEFARLARQKGKK